MLIYPKLSKYNYVLFRLGGHGLGNLLFPFARAVVTSNKYNIPIINPTWFQIKPGSYLRNENDKRTYHNIFNPYPNSIKGYNKLIKIISHKKIDEVYFFNNQDKYIHNNKDICITFEGVLSSFEGIKKNHVEVKNAIYSIVNKNNIPDLDSINFIAIHIRLGDFRISNSQTNPSFFINILEQIRAVNKTVDIQVFTDGNKEEIKYILDKYNARKVFYGSSIADMLAMSKSSLLIASKSSTFSQWASYLGRMSTIWPIETNTDPIFIESDTNEEIYIGDNMPSLNRVLLSNISTL